MRLGIPHPRLTYAPSGNSNAARCAICSRINRGFAMPSASITFFSLPLSGIPIFTMALSGIAEPFRLHDAMNEDRGSHDVFRIDGADRNDFFDFSDSRLGGHGHNGIEISCRQPIGQISQLIGSLRLDQRIISVNRPFENAAAFFEDALFLSCGNFRAYAHRGVETLQTSSGSAHALAQNALRDEFQRHFLGGETFQKMIGVRSGKSGNHVLDLIVLEHDSKLAVTRPAIVADSSDVLRAFPRQRLNEVIWKARASESPDHDLRAIGNIRDGFVEAGADFLLHRALAAPARMLGRNLAATPLACSQRPVSVALKSCSSRARKSASSSTSISSRTLRRTITWAWEFSASARCFAKLPFPKCDGKRVGGVRSMAFVPVPSHEGTITKEGARHSTARSSSMSLDWISGRSSGKRSNPVTPLCSQSFEAASTEWLSDICCSSRRISQPFSSANCMAGS